MFYGRGTTALICVGYALLFGPDQDNIDEVIRELKDYGILLTVEEDVHAFLCVEVKTDINSGKVTLTQGGLTKKLMNTLGMLDGNNNITLSSINSLVKDAGAPPFDEPWYFDFFIGVLMYLYRNFRPDIQFTVHQCVRFTHNPSKSRSDAVNRILLNLVVTK